MSYAARQTLQCLQSREWEQECRVTDAHISLLVNSGLLARHPVHPDSLTFAMAGIGPAIKSLVKGRKVPLHMCCCMELPPQPWSVHFCCPSLQN